MSEFEYSKMIEQILNQQNQKERDELFDFIGQKGDDRFVEPLTELISLDDSPKMRQSLYATLTKIGTKLAEEVIKDKVKKQLPKDDGKLISKKSWDEAVSFLVKNLEQPSVKQISELIKTDGNLWGVKNKGGIGIYIRNLLRNNGFDWGEASLEVYWSWVAEEAVTKISAKK
ncbi:MAG: hypothetical protein FK731_03710 [Asgard group archaeon]|nr:hypothetical protein [Asgard group archaeon]